MMAPSNTLLWNQSSFAPLRQTQKELETSKKPTIIQMLPMIEEINSKIVFLASVIADPKTFEVPRSVTTVMASVTGSIINEIY